MLIDTPFGFSFDVTFWQNIFALPVPQLIFVLFILGGWVAMYLLFFKTALELWAKFLKTKFTRKWKWVILAVDIPPLFIQTPKAVEQIFAQLSGSISSISVKEKYTVGKTPKNFSFEIISIEGYIQFLVRTEEEFRDLVEAAIYAQYAEAEITEVEDYVDNIPDKFPDENYDVLVVDFKLAQPSPYPIRTYPSFEYNISKDQVFSDPMAAILETFSRISRGENFWLQLIIEPTSNDWKEAGIKFIKELISGKKTSSEPFIFKILSFPLSLLHEVASSFVGGGKEDDKKKKPEKKDAPEGKISDLTPGVKSTIEAMEEKLSMIGFKSKLRILYAARKDIFNPTRCINGFVGAMNQFHMVNRNAIVPDKKSSSPKPKKTYKLKRKFVKAYKKRDIKNVLDPYLLNIQELATVWHFPLPFVKTPLVQKAGAKRAEPPLGLPVEWAETPLKKRGQSLVSEPPKEPKGKPPDELMFG
jgi:hypothetical protein